MQQETGRFGGSGAGEPSHSAAAGKAAAYAAAASAEVVEESSSWLARLEQSAAWSRFFSTEDADEEDRQALAAASTTTSSSSKAPDGTSPAAAAAAAPAPAAAGGNTGDKQVVLFERRDKFYLSNVIKVRLPFTSCMSWWYRHMACPRQHQLAARVLAHAQCHASARAQQRSLRRNQLAVDHQSPKRSRTGLDCKLCHHHYIDVMTGYLTKRPATSPGCSWL
jgi:hypothetical protein